MLPHSINGRHLNGNMFLRGIILQKRDGQTWKPNQNLDCNIKFER